MKVVSEFESEFEINDFKPSPSIQLPLLSIQLHLQLPPLAYSLEHLRTVLVVQHCQVQFASLGLAGFPRRRHKLQFRMEFPLEQ